MRVLVSDTSVLIDLERAVLLPRAFGLAAEFAVPDVLFEHELRPYGGAALLTLGLRVESLDGDGVARAAAYRRTQRALTVADSFALALAKQTGWILLTGDGALRTLADSEQIESHGILWLLDLMETEKAAPMRELCDGLQRITAHPRCRLPKPEVETRLQRYLAAIAE